MDQLKPIERIGAALNAAMNLLEAAAGVNEEISDELSETRARMFDPSPEQQDEALAAWPWDRTIAGQSINTKNGEMKCHRQKVN